MGIVGFQARYPPDDYRRLSFMMLDQDVVTVSSSTVYEHYNSKRLHSALGYVALQDYLEGQGPGIQAERGRKLSLARQQRLEERPEKERAA